MVEPLKKASHFDPYTLAHRDSVLYKHIFSFSNTDTTMGDEHLRLSSHFGDHHDMTYNGLKKLEKYILGTSILVHRSTYVDHSRRGKGNKLINTSACGGGGGGGGGNGTFLAGV